MKKLITTVKVRSYELDSFKHINNGVYAHYLEKARGDYLQQIGLTFTSFDELKAWPVIAHLEIDYKYPAFFGEELSIEAVVSALGKSSITLNYKMYNQDRKLIITASTRMVFVGENGKPTQMPEVFRKGFVKYGDRKLETGDRKRQNKRS
ncbi:MAG: thioesterase family protein [Candidatus Marinimicrobia bacterium]|nr:thioesterase family protein [Candidatus Neomarinimicrobiota bacterium]